jgi:50S ribosomal protein L16 3-hydroxylase
MSESIDLPGRYSDPDLKATTKPAEIGNELLETVAEQIAKVQLLPLTISLFFWVNIYQNQSLRYFSRPRKNLYLLSALSRQKKGN